MAERAVDVIKLLMKQGQMNKITDVIDADTAQLIAEELGHSVKRVSDLTLKKALRELMIRKMIYNQDLLLLQLWDMLTMEKQVCLTR